MISNLLRRFINKMEPKNFCESLTGFIDVARDISTMLPYKKSGLPPYWVRCLESFSSAITSKIVQDYDLNNIPEKDRFPRLRNEFSNLYDLFLVEFSSDLLITVDGKKQLNDSWLRNKDSNSLDVEEEEEIITCNIFSGLSQNEGISIVIKKKEPDTKKVDIELPVSELLEAGIILRKSGVKKPHYPLSVFYYLYKCVMFSVPNHCEKMTKITTDIFPLTLKEGSTLEKQLNKAKKYIAPMMKNNSKLFENLMSKVRGGIDDIPDENVDEISRIAQEQIAGLENKNGDIQSIFSSFLPNSDVNGELEKQGISIESIRNLVDREGSGKISNEDLMASIPSLNDILNSHK